MPEKIYVKVGEINIFHPRKKQKKGTKMVSRALFIFSGKKNTAMYDTFFSFNCSYLVKKLQLFLSGKEFTYINIGKLIWVNCGHYLHIGNWSIGDFMEIQNIGKLRNR